MPTLYSATITTAVTGVTGTVFEFAADTPRNVTLQGNFTYGSGGLTADAWVQTTFDEGATWSDIANFHFTTSSARKAFNLSSLTPVTTQATPTDGTLAANTAVDGLIGGKLRVKVTTTGTYAGNTTLAIDAITSRIESR